MADKVCIEHPDLDGCVSVSPKSVNGWRERGWVPVEEVSATVVEPDEPADSVGELEEKEGSE